MRYLIILYFFFLGGTQYSFAFSNDKASADSGIVTDAVQPKSKKIQNNVPVQHYMKNNIFCAINHVGFREKRKQLLKWADKLGFHLIFYQDLMISAKPFYPRLIETIEKSDIFIADLTPWLGVEPDSDITFLMGIAAAKNKPVFSYMNSDQTFFERILDWNNVNFKKDGIFLRDRDGNRIENMGKVNDKTLYKENDPFFIDNDNMNNLMLEGPSYMSATPVLTPDIIGTKIDKRNIYNSADVFNAELNLIRQRSKTGQLGVKRLPKYDILSGSQSFYLAGPDVFFKDMEEVYKAKKHILASMKLHGVSPVEDQLDFDVMQKWAHPKNGNNPKMREAIYLADLKAMHITTGGLFNLSPFRGATPDSGTVFELGYTMGIGKQKFEVYSNDPRPLIERIVELKGKWGGAEALKYKIYKGEIYHSILIDDAIYYYKRSVKYFPTSEQYQVLQSKISLIGKGAYFSDLFAFRQAAEAIDRKRKPAALSDK